MTDERRPAEHHGSDDDPFAMLLSPGKVVSVLGTEDGPLVIDEWLDSEELVLTHLHPVTDQPGGLIDLCVPAGEAAWRVTGTARPLDDGRLAFHPIGVTERIQDRAYTRVKIEVGAEIASVGPRAIGNAGSAPTWLPARTLDVSAGGIAISGLTLPVGAVVIVRTTVPGPAGPVEVVARARVVRRVERPVGTNVTGLMWVDLDLSTRRDIAEAVLALTEQYG